MEVKRLRWVFTPVIFGVIATVGIAYAAPLAVYNLDSTLSSSDTDTYSVASAITATGIPINYRTVNSRTGLAANAREIADSGVDYLSFTLTAAQGRKLDLSLGSISLTTYTTHKDKFSYTLRSSVDNYTANLASVSLSTQGQWTVQTHDLVSFSGFETLDSVTFRINVFNSNNTPSQWVYFDVISIIGATAVPEPTTGALVLLGGIMVAFRRARNRPTRRTELVGK